MRVQDKPEQEINDAFGLCKEASRDPEAGVLVWA